MYEKNTAAAAVPTSGSIHVDHQCCCRRCGINTRRCCRCSLANHHQSPKQQQQQLAAAPFAVAAAAGASESMQMRTTTTRTANAINSIMLAASCCRFSLLLLLLLPLLMQIGLTLAISDGALKLNAKCKDLFTCTVQNRCVAIRALQSSFENATIGKDLYNELDKHVDYGCIFTSGCMEECNKCPLCMTSKQQLVDVLSGNRRAADGECAVLVNCAAECVDKSQHDLNKISYCLRHKCAFHCFDGSCPKCSAFVTRIFNQICIAGDFRKRIQEWKGHCYEMFRAIVMAKFEQEFGKSGSKPSIGNSNRNGREQQQQQQQNSRHALKH